MRQQYHFRQTPRGLAAWDVYRLIDLSRELPVEQVPLAQIRELDEAFWYDLGGAKPTCRNIAEHAGLIHAADLSYPIILCHEGRVMDGMHRVCKAQMLGHETIKAFRFKAPVPPDHVGVAPDSLPYDD